MRRGPVPEASHCKDWCRPTKHKFCMGACCPHLHTPAARAARENAKKEARS
jgi:hypothetical protein